MRREISKSTQIFIGFVIVMILIKIVDIIFNPNKIFAGRIEMFPWQEILLVLILGGLGLWGYKQINLPKFLNEKFKTKKALWTSIGLGLGFAIIFVIYDSFVRIGNISVGLPISILFYIWGAIVSESIYRLFAIGFFGWIFGNLIFKRRYNKQIYWILAIIFSGIAAFSMLAAFSLPGVPLVKPSTFLFILLGGLVFISELVSFNLLKKYGFLSSLLFRLSFYSIWYIIWPVIFY